MKMKFFNINEKRLPMKIHYFIGIGASASIMPFIPTIAKQKGYSAFVVGLIYTLLPLPGLLVRPIVGSIADKYKCRKLALILSSCFTALLVCSLLFMCDTAAKEEIDDVNVFNSPLFWLFFSTVTALTVASVARTLLEDTICVDLLGDDRNKYGEQRMWGAIGWGTFSVITGACVDWYSKGQEYKDYRPGIIISIICSLIDVYVVTKIKAVQNNDVKMVTSDVMKIITNIKVLVFLIWTVFFGIFCSMIWNFEFWYLEDLANMYHPETISWIKTLQGLVLTIQCFGGEVPLFFLSSFILKRVDQMNIFSLMFFTFSLRFFLYSIIRNPFWVLPVELLNGITYALSYSAAISYTSRITPTGAECLLQGIVGTTIAGIGGSIGSMIGGYLFKRIGSIATFQLLSLVAIVTCIVQIVVNQLIKRFCNWTNIDKNDTEAKVNE